MLGLADWYHLLQVSVHVRHGDKSREMELHSWDEHLQRIDELVRGRGIEERSIFLSTEDPQVVEAATAQRDWKVYVLPYERDNGDFGHVNQRGVSHGHNEVE